MQSINNKGIGEKWKLLWEHSLKAFKTHGLFNIFHVANGYNFSFGLKNPKTHKYIGRHFQAPSPPPPLKKFHYEPNKLCDFFLTKQ